MKIALFKYPHIDIALVRREEDEGYCHGVRISEYVDVDFPPRDAAEVGALLEQSKRAQAEKLRKQLQELET